MTSSSRTSQGKRPLEKAVAISKEHGYRGPGAGEVYKQGERFRTVRAENRARNT